MSDELQAIPDTLIDDEGYPTRRFLRFIENYKPSKELPLPQFVESILYSGWYMADWGFRLRRKYKGKRKLELHTGGWSGNEEIIAAIKLNMWLTHFQMKYVMWRVGGHHYFEISYDAHTPSVFIGQIENNKTD